MSLLLLTAAPRVVIPTAEVTWRRNAYFDLTVQIGPGVVRTKLGRAWRAVQAVLADLEAGSQDGHRAPTWSIGASFPKFGKAGDASAVNRSIIGVDLVAGQPLGVVAVRRWLRTKYQQKHGFHGRTSIAWFLVGRNEGTRLPFAHAINPRPIVRGLSSNTSHDVPVTLARCWVFDVSPDQLGSVLRQGDVALVPVKRLPGGRRERIAGVPEGVQVLDSHVLQAAEAWRVGSVMYARDPYLQHLAGQHADVRATGWHRVQVGLRTTPRPFARPIGD